MWFDDIMDDSKNALKLANKNAAVFIPILINAAVSFVFAIIVFVCAVFLAIGFGGTIKSIYHGYQSPLIVIIPALLAILVIYLAYTAVKAMMEVGSVNMYKAAYQGIKPGAHHFFEGIRKYFWRVFGVTLFFNFIVVILLIPILILLALYSVTIGVLTAGWGLIFLWAVIGAFLSSWVIAVVMDDIGAFEGIGRSLSLGKKHFWPLFIFNFAGAMIAQHVSMVFGGLVALLGGWFISAAIMLYFKIAIMLFYERKKGELFAKNNIE